MAIKILSLTSSSSGCERNWSTFDMVHTKRRNRLDAIRASNLVYVQFNTRLASKQERRKSKNIDVLLANDAMDAQEWIIECDDDVDPEMDQDEAIQPRRSTRLRELHEDDFQSDPESQEEEEEKDVEFESYQDEVVPSKDYVQDDEDCD